MKRRESQTLNHLISAGNKTFPSVPAKGNNATIQIFYKDLNAADITLSVEQSTGTSKFDIITGVSKQLDSTLTSHTFNIIGINTDLIQVALDVGAGTLGEIERINYIFE